jgi:WD40 repeat protein
VRGYTTFTQQRGDEAAAELTTRFSSIARETLEAAGGFGLEFRGDEVMAAFTSARQAIRTAVDLQAAFVEATIADPSFPLPVGIGLDAGEAVEVAEGYASGALNLAARLCSQAGPGEILASREVVHLARRVEGVSMVDRGSVRLKGLSDPVQLTRLTRDGWAPESDSAFQQAMGRAAGRLGAGFAVCPYRGLAAFQPDDADRFFGRDELVSDLVQRLDRDRILFVVGPSGSGKSSLVRAGLIPALRSGAILGSEGWAVALFSPRSSPTEELTYQLRRIAGWVLSDRHISPATDARSLADAVCDVTGGLVMVIDQFEELFTLNRRPEQEAFVEQLQTIADSVGSRLRLTLAMRADFYGISATFPWLAWRATANQVLVGPMRRADMRKVIEQPAASAGLRLEDGLVDAVLEDAGTGSASLPLVSHAMVETWRRREGDTLTLAGYRAAGGVAGSIAQSADSLYEAAFDTDEKDACRRLMLRLVAPGEGTSDARHRLPMSDLDRDHNPEIGRKIVAEMTDARLLTIDRDTLEIAHEALLQSWPRLRRWIDDARDDLRMRQRIAHAAAEWSAQGRDADLLYRGAPLQAALEWAEERGDVLGPPEEEFLSASQEAFIAARRRSEEAARRSRRLWRIAVSTLAVLTAAAIGATVIAFSALGESRSRYAQALATQARLLASSDPRTAIALAAEASARSNTDPIDARAALVAASQTLAARFVPSGSPVSVGDASTVVVSPDGSLVVTGNRDGSISTWDPGAKTLAVNVAGHAKAIEEMDITPDGRWLVSGSDDSSVILWDLAEPAAPKKTVLGRTTDIVWSVTVAPDGATAASASEDGTIRLWSLDERRRLGPIWGDRDKDAITASFSPDGELLMVGNGRGEVTGYATDSRRVVIPTFSAHRSDVWEIEFAPGGSRFATASSDGRIRIWKTSTHPELLAEPFERSGWDVRGVLLDKKEVLAGNEEGRLLIAPSDGSARPSSFVPRHGQIVDAAWGGGTLVTLGADQRMQVWTRGDEPTAMEIEEHTDGAFAIGASPNGDLIATGDGDGNVRLFSTATGQLELGPVRVHDGRVWDLAFSDDGSRLASGGEDGKVEVISATTGDRIHSLPASDAPIRTVLFAGGRLLAGGDDTMVRIWEGQTPTEELGPHQAGITAMALAPDGALAVADLLGGVRLWNLESGEQMIELEAEDNTIWGLAWSTDGETLATATDDEVVKLWDAGSHSLIGSLTGHRRGALDVAFLEDGATVATTSRDGSVRLWDYAETELLGDRLEGHSESAWRVAALPGMRFATSSEDGTVRIWDVLNPERACERAAGPLGFASLGPFLGEGEEPIACADGNAEAAGRVGRPF